MPKYDYGYIAHPVNQTESYPIGEADGSHLSDLDREWLSRIPSVGWEIRGKANIDYMTDTRSHAEKAAEWTPARLGNESVVIAYRGEFGLAMGAVRARHVAGHNGYKEDTYEASPFPGGWEYVPVSRILLVRHAETI